jgi:hypothetical protein
MNNLCTQYMLHVYDSVHSIARTALNDKDEFHIMTCTSSK